MTPRTPPPNLPGDSSADSVAYRVARVTAHAVPRVMGALSASLREKDDSLHPAQLQVLMMMHASQISPSQLAERLQVSLPTISKTVSVLERRGWIERSVDEHDRRRIALRLTASGRETVKSVLTHGIEQLARTLSVATDEELETIESGMHALQAALARAHETFGYRHCRRAHHPEETTR